MRCEIGRVGFVFSGNLKVAEHICREFQQKGIETDYDIQIKIRPKKNLSLFSGDFKKSEKGRFFDTGYSVSYPNESNMIVSIDRSILRKGLIERMAKVRDWNYLTPSEIVAKNLIYDLLEPISHDHMVKNGMGFVHASAFSKGGSCALVTGEGGMGKTALCIIAQEKDFGYMNDDLSLIDSRGLCYHHPKRLQIYGYNIKESQELKGKIFRDRGSLDRMQFNFRNMFYGPKKVRRRVPSHELFESIAKKARISKVFYLARGSQFNIQKMKDDEFVESEIEIIQKEFSDYLSGLEHLDLGRYEEFLESTRKLYRSLFETSEVLKVSAPFPYDLRKLFEHLQKKHPISSK